nr:MAG TPA: replisome organizer protein [Caudoviricetes sp.]
MATEKSGKRYYWLKLQDDFFKSKRIKKLRKIAGGDTYTIIYLKMQLLAMKNNGVLEFTGLENTFAEELALDLDEEPDNVNVTINFLLSTGLMETSDNVRYFVPYAVENTGSEGASAARVRRHRCEKALQCNADVTPVKQNCNGEIEIELEKDIDAAGAASKQQQQQNPNLALIATVYEANIGSIAPAEFDLIRSWANGYTSGLVVAVIKDACLRKKKSARYIDTVLRKCAQEGVQNAADYQTRIDAYSLQNAATGQTKRNPAQAEQRTSKTESFMADMQAIYQEFEGGGSNDGAGHGANHGAVARELAERNPIPGHG